jgi:hypothetical protein
MHLSMNRTACLLCLALLLALGAVGSADETLRIVPVIHDDEVSVSFELADAYTDDVRAAIASGLKTTFTYDVELRMAVSGWINRTIASVVVTTTDQYDNLTRRHTMTRIVDGLAEDERTTEDEAVVRKWLTTLTRLPLCRTTKLAANREYYVLISARARPNRGSLLGWVSPVRGQTKFTFIP